MESETLNLARWRDFVTAMESLVTAGLPEAEVLARGAPQLGALVARDDWLPAAFAVPDSDRYQQHLLHRDPRGWFSVVSFVWSPRQATPIHDHCVWGLVGMLRGAERSQRFVRGEDGIMREHGEAALLEPGDVEALSPVEGDIHQVTNARDGVSISVHVYGADIGVVERHSFARDGSVRSFVSGYSDTIIPEFWTQEIL